ncbi:hypothetical protein [Klebsiella quasipneumoniae]|uniref:hypothetical protein n=1 Tax=Klebsiella quasipneumoniae TaxID=1463165 RepID=UPI002006B1FE|nr:hypothetical protein [Klebsiella quasipneumoniae]MCK6040361.1 hypothetical protein [Klebsiella quasipneumoniae]
MALLEGTQSLNEFGGCYGPEQDGQIQQSTLAPISALRGPSCVFGEQANRTPSSDVYCRH